MNFDYSDTQTMVQDSLSRFLADRYDFETRQKISRSDAGWSQEMWTAFAEELGILGAPFSEEDGGLGGGPVENMLIMEEMGKALVVEPYLSTVVIGGGFAREAGRSDIIEGIIGGEVRGAFAWAEPKGRYNLDHVEVTAKASADGYTISGHKAVVRDAPSATHLFVTARTGGNKGDARGVSVFVVPADAKGVSMTDYPLVDGGIASEVTFENVAVGKDALLGGEGEGSPMVRKIVDEAIAALCSEGIGVMEKLHKLTMEYTQERKQFGVPISKFQVLQHRMVDMFMELEQSKSMTLMATLKLPDTKAASMAKAKVGKGLTYCGQQAVQLFGGNGISEEYAVGHYFKRATIIESQFGSTDHHIQRYERLTLDD
ncbi:MAG: acyl-CoA dehydrogenase family protein [Pacificimonas sp.]